MPNPTKYAPQYSFSGFQAQSPDRPLPAMQLDNELQNIANATAETIDALGTIRRSDGQLFNGIVSIDSLSPDVLAAIATGGGGALGINDIVGLTTALSGKASITALTTGLAGKANTAHAHAQADVTGLVTALAGKQAVLGFTPENAANKGQASGYAALGTDGKVPSSQLPAASGGTDDAAAIFYRPTGFPTLAIPVAQRLGQEVTLTDGYVEGSNLTDFSDLIAANLARAVTTKRPFIIPHGIFKAKRQFVAEGTSMAMYGLGKYQSAIQWTVDAASAGFRFTSGTDRKRPDFMHFEKFALLTEQFNQGEALWASFEPQIAPNNGNPVVANRYSTRFRVQDVAIAGVQGATFDGWNKGITCLYEIDAILRDYQFNGPINGSEPNYLAEWAAYIGAANGYGHPTGPFVDTCNIFHAKKGVVFEGNEGGVVTNSQIVGVIVGVDFIDNAGRPLLMCTNNHINAFGACIRADAASQIQIIGNSLYHTIGADRDGAGVSISSTQATSQHLVVQGNIFESAIGSSRIFTGVVVYGCDHGIIDGNTFRPGVVSPTASNMNGIVLSSNARFIKVGDNNVFEDTRSGRPALINQIQDGGVSNYIPGMGVRFSKSASQGLSPGSLNIVNFDVIGDPVGNFADTMEDGAYVVPSDGIWEFIAGVQLTNGVDGGVTTNIQLNATSGNPITSDVSTYDTGTPPAKTITTGPRKFRRNDVLRVGVNTGNSRSVTNALGTFFEARRLK